MNKANRQMFFNNDIKSGFHINEQQIINNFLNNYKNTIFKTIITKTKYIHGFQNITRISMNVDVISNYVINIEQSILLSKLKVVPSFIISQEEILNS